MMLNVVRYKPRLTDLAHRVLPSAVWNLGRDLVFGETRPQQWRTGRRNLRARDVALVCRTFRSVQAIAENAAATMDALEAAGVPYLVVDAPENRSRTVCVSERDRDSALTAIAALDEDTPTFVTTQGAGRRSGFGRSEARAVTLRDEPRARRFLPGVRVFRRYVAPDGSPLAGAELGCDVEFWRETPDEVVPGHAEQAIPAGSLRAVRPNRWVESLTPAERRPTPGSVDGTRRPRLPSASIAHQQDVSFPIDVVYTWVDGSDPAWQARKVETLAGCGMDGLHELATSDARFASRDELRFSMRSLDMFAGWVRHVFLVTDRQVPAWLNTADPRLSVIDHRDLFGGRGRLPTFNSHAIESQLHLIPGLSEHFLYLNDDVFFGRPVAPELFFHANGLAKFFPSVRKLGLGPLQPADSPAMAGAKNGRDLMAKVFDVTLTTKYRHVPHPVRRSVLEEIAEEYPWTVEETAASQFRSATDYAIPSWLHHAYAYERGLAVPGDLAYAYVNIADPQAAARIRRLLRHRDLDVFCLNDLHTPESNSAELTALLQKSLKEYFPLPSTFEGS